MKRKKLLYCDSNIDGTVGGAYYSLYYLVEGLDKSVYDPIVVFYRDNPLIPMYEKAGIKTKLIHPIQPIHLSLAKNRIKWVGQCFSRLQSGINFSRFMLLQALRFAIYLKRNRVDLVHLNNSVLRSHNWMLAAMLLNIKCVSHERGINSHFSTLARFFIRRLDAVICISNAVRKNMENQGLNSQNLVTIYNGLDPKRVVVTKSRAEIRREFNLSKNTPVIGIVGNIKCWKGQDTVVLATKEIKKRFPNIKCLIVGDTAKSDRPFLEELNAIVSKCNLEKDIIFTGYRENVPDYMNAMDIVIHASTQGEPFGRVLLEAMALEKPLIGARGGAVPEIINEPYTGLMFQPGNYDELAMSIIRLLDNPQKSIAMGRRGRSRLEKHYHISNNIERTQALYHALLEQK
jgi:glycosyltransferase involved in cell wall biosynthesis